MLENDVNTECPLRKVRQIAQNFTMKPFFIEKIFRQPLLRRTFSPCHVNHVRCLASKPRNTSELTGVTGIKRKGVKKEKKHDPDEEFMQLWSTTEGYIQNVFKERRTGIKSTKENYRNTFVTPNVTTLPIASELTKEERDDLLDDDGTTEFRIPTAEDFARLTPVYKSLTEEELDDEKIFERKDERGEEERENKEESDVIDTSKILSFEDFDLHPKLIQKLNIFGIVTPTDIQKQAIPIVLKGKSVLIQSETGSGKTMIFLLPTLQSPGKTFGTIIIAPTRELASQMLFEARRLLGDKAIVESFVSGVNLSKQEARLKDKAKKPLIAIGTPKRILEIIEKDPSLVQRTKRIIIDEVDKVLLPLHRRSSFKKLTHRANYPRAAKTVVEKVLQLSKVKHIQMIGASATVNDVLQEDLTEIGWGDHVKLIQSSTLEGWPCKVPPCIKHQYVICDESVGLTKAQALARVFRESGQKSGLVFIHRLQSVDDFVWELRDLGLNAVALYQKVANQDPEEYEKFLTEFQTGQINVVVGTEETVRGLDFKELDHVYLTEVARNIDAYLHQAGRVGRQGRPGTATTLVSVRNPRDEKRMQMEYRRLNLPFERIVL